MREKNTPLETLDPSDTTKNPSFLVLRERESFDVIREIGGEGELVVCSPQNCG